MSFQPHVLLLLNSALDLEKINVEHLILSTKFTVFYLFFEEIYKLGNYLATKNIGVILSVDDDWKQYDSHISKFGNRYNKMWIHKTFDDFHDVEQISNSIINCYIHNVSHNNFFANVISVFTTAYNSKEMIYRPYNTLLAQTYKNWEFVIINDSDENNFDETQQILENIANNDPRVKLFKYYRHSGFIGEVKNFASKMCHGYVTVEVDHDDELADTLLEKMHQLYQSDKNIGFVYSDFCELYENKVSFTYGEYFGFGFGSYCNKFYKGQWYATCNTPSINPLTLTDIIGVPNHVRSWRSSVLQKIGYYNDLLYVADDYDLLIKTFLETKMARLPILGYFQYRNSVIGNHTFKRLDQIRQLQYLLSHHYKSDINLKILDIFSKNDANLLEKGFDLQNMNIDNVLQLQKHDHILAWERPYNWQDANFNYVHYDQKKVSVIISTYNRPDLLKRAINSVLNQTFKNFEIIVIGDKCPVLESIMQHYYDDRIIWWNLYKNYNDNGTTPKNYALRMCLTTSLVTYLDDDNYWEPNHLESLYSLFEKDESVSYAFSSMVMGNYNIICTKPLLYRIDTSCIMHKQNLLNKYGYWRSHKEVGYSHDFEFVSRWVNEKYNYTSLPTMIYNLEGSLNNPEKIYNAYGDKELLKIII